jgi:Protein of unknown function (DUF2462)
MVQGFGKLKSGKGSSGKNNKKAAKNSKPVIKKGRRNVPTTTNNTNSLTYHQAQRDTTKAINKKNEVIVAAKAVASGSRFFLSDVTVKGTNELKKQHQIRSKKELKNATKNNKNGSAVTESLKKQLRKLGRNV